MILFVQRDFFPARLNYVNSFPVDAVRFGIQTLSPKFFGGAPDFVVSGPNVGSQFASSQQQQISF